MTKIAPLQTDSPHHAASANRTTAATEGRTSRRITLDVTTTRATSAATARISVMFRMLEPIASDWHREGCDTAGSVNVGKKRVLLKVTRMVGWCDVVSRSDQRATQEDLSEFQELPDALEYVVPS
jgi:hypothetical protein